MSSTHIYTFKPTFLYIKQHNVTGLMYFGKTVNDPEKYLGSGSYWKKHIKKHGREHVVNLWYCLFLDEQDCKDFAIWFSETQNIVESKDWANILSEQVEETNNTKGFAVAKDLYDNCIGLVSLKDKRWDTGEIVSINKNRKLKTKRKHTVPAWNKGLTKTNESVAKYIENSRAKKKLHIQTEEHKKKNSESNSGEKHWHFGGKNSAETRLKISKANKGKVRSIESNLKVSQTLKRSYHKILVSRLEDKKVMELGGFMAWLSHQLGNDIKVTRIHDKKPMRLCDFNKWVKNNN